jgi:two-component system sensor histidine kinase EvgS
VTHAAAGALRAAWLLVLCLGLGWAQAQTQTQAPGGPYRFRQAPQPGLVTPATDLLDAKERGFLAGLPVLRVGLNLPDNRPYEVIADNGEISGIQVEILTRLAQAMGLRLEPVVLPDFPSTLAALRERRIDLMTTVGYEPAREAYMAFTLGTAPNPGAVLGRQADNRLAAEPSLNGRRVAIERGYVTRYHVQRLYPDALISERNDTADALRAVALGEDDYYFGSLLMALDRLQRDGIGGLAVKRSLVYATGQMHFGVRSDWPLLASALSKGVAAMRPSPMPSLQAALSTLGSHGGPVPRALPLQPDERTQLAGRSVLRVGAVRGLTLLNEATPNGGHAGIGADYTVEVAARLGTAVDVVPFDSVADMLDALRAGRIHLVPFLTRTPARAREFSFSDPYLEMPYQIVARSDAPLYWDLNSLRGKRLALAAQHPLRELLAERYADIRIVDAPSGQAAMDMVASRRCRRRRRGQAVRQPAHPQRQQRRAAAGGAGRRPAGAVPLRHVGGHGGPGAADQPRAGRHPGRPSATG